MCKRSDHGCRPVPMPARICRGALRVGSLAIAMTALAALDLPRLPWVGVDLGAAPAFAKNGGGNSDRGRGDRGRGQERRQARLDQQGPDAGRRIWNRPQGRDHDDNGRHLGHLRRADRSDTAAAPEDPPLPPRRPDAGDGEFHNHGDRVSTLVHLAKAVGLSASVGAMQANFGTPFENGLVAIDPATGDYEIDATDAEIAAVKPGNGPKSGWETETGLDVNMDGVVDQADLDEALAGESPAGGEIPDDQDDDPDDALLATLRVGRANGEATP